MKTLSNVSTIFFLLFSQMLYSQGWFADGDRWQYTGGGLSELITYTTLTVAEDTVISGITCKRIDELIEQVNIDDEIVNQFDGIYGIVYEEDDRVYYYHNNSEEFRLLYDFNLEVGDTITYFSDLKFELVEARYEEIEGDSLRYQKFEVTDEFDCTHNLLPLEIVENIGIVNTLYDGQNGLIFSYGCGGTGDFLNHFTCFSSNDYTYPMSSACSPRDNPISNTEELQIDGHLSLYPNPVSAVLNWDTELDVNLIEIYTIKGELILTESPQTNSTDLSILNDGLYVIKFITDDYTITQKFLKSER